jgi:hypothetical protein
MCAPECVMFAMHVQVPFALLATAYRRKRIMEGLISGDREVMAQVRKMGSWECSVYSHTACVPVQ